MQVGLALAKQWARVDFDAFYERNRITEIERLQFIRIYELCKRCTCYSCFIIIMPLLQTCVNVFF